jgi:hypothetical protein
MSTPNDVNKPGADRVMILLINKPWADFAADATGQGGLVGEATDVGSGKGALAFSHSSTGPSNGILNKCLMDASADNQGAVSILPPTYVLIVDSYGRASVATGFNYVQGGNPVLNLPASATIQIGPLATAGSIRIVGGPTPQIDISDGTAWNQAIAIF